MTIMKLERLNSLLDINEKTKSKEDIQDPENENGLNKEKEKL
jgi:hypothetical protein